MFQLPTPFNTSGNRIYGFEVFRGVVENWDIDLKWVKWMELYK